MKEKSNYNKPIERYNNNRRTVSDGPSLLFENLIWLTTKEASVYLSRSVNAIHTLVSRGQIRARKYSNRLYFKKEELDYLIETSQFKGG